MKKVLFAFAALLSLFCVPSFAQGNYVPHEGWPLIYENFESGAARTKAGALVTEALLNVSVIDGSLLYVDASGLIIKADMSSVFTAKVSDDVYVNIQGKLYKLLSELDKGYVLSLTVVDEDKLGKADIGYGISSSTASVQNLSVLLDGRSNLINKSVEQSIKNKFDTPELPVKLERYLYVNGRMVPASRNSLINYPGVDKKAALDFIKKEKIKWKDVSSLEKLVIFLDVQFAN